MNVLTNSDVFYDVKGKKKREKKEKPKGGFRGRVQNIKNNPLFQTAAGAYGGYLQQKYQNPNVDVSAGAPQAVVTGDVVRIDEPAKKEPMSRTTKIAIGVGVAALIGVAAYFVIKNKKKLKVKK
jgi:hypothetical protein